jgi:cobalt/nickel transport system ATP-binding protein
MSLLEARALVHTYPGNVRALDGLDLRIERGRRLAILGPNGSGKTTLLLHLNGTLRPQSGEVLLNGEVMGYNTVARAQAILHGHSHDAGTGPRNYDSATLTAWRRRVGLVLQNADDQLFAAGVAEDVSFGPLNMGLSDADARKRVTDALAAMHISDLADRATHMLSFGQKKRVAIAGLVAMQPEILLLDEPSAGLDHQGTEDLLEVLAELERAGTTLVFSTHDVEMAYRFGDEVALFESGKILAQGPIAEILADVDLVKRAKLETPLLLKLGLRARELGLLQPHDPLPRTPAAALQLLDRLAVVKR